MKIIPDDCSAQAYAAQFTAKATRVATLMREFAAPDPQLYASPPRHYRQRAEFRIWHCGDDLFYAMFERGEPRTPLRIDDFAPASWRINELMRALRIELLRVPTLRQRLYQVEFLDTLAGESLITLVYHRPLGLEWEDAARELEVLLGARLIGRSRGQRVVISEPYVSERLAVDGEEFVLRQPEGCFTQPNAQVNRAMLSWARAVCGDSPDDLLELYCGIGNFTVALASRFRTVLATEINTGAIATARHNLAANGVCNTFVARLSSAEAAAALARERAFFRLREFDLDALQPATLLVDPPRAGLDPRTLDFAAGFERIVYVSCNPHTLCVNLKQLQGSHRIESLALFDQFPYTEHIECGVLLQRLGSAP
ncbi:MAG: tRNA (uridine(54)-C5)-methyltransferase TrmA [Gammaproteobacteria bacterium]|jgi:tRNA (uracil-5-)-methyltransferase|nr:tRNA (uridine(54)-C5)-methyltransferase TrmA [Gammaproteobacteria bacterium]MBP6050669.1 tRNA (uridine(54)-C5)-methyltransferase TrmA [Pseudomonadales bacterium]MBK6585484.1 tRNA (uridine(54)-C5)-methyltransferase TrmA [Gammaproteobacteria bacterium]MBK7168867.1 tRNA (uridine(54)-C5)-methyltransferase TrmA [Gammaproteobacteria bacterium]MBK7521021.1 tRNA (uridine(54)-C5)-methyltransferase TrmA [Gammaproteobacteria bacterium]